MAGRPGPSLTWKMVFTPSSRHRTSPVPPFLLKTSRLTNGSGPYATSLSTNDGATWTDVDLGTPVMRFEFLGPDVGWGGKSKNNGEETQVYRYTGDFIFDFLQNKELEVALEVFPNPVVSDLDIAIQNDQKSAYQLLVNDQDGRLMMRSPIDVSFDHTTQIGMSDYPAGIYFITLMNETGSKSVRVTKV